MKLWLLRPDPPKGHDPWEPWHDKAFGFVVRAETEEEARRLANEEAGDENKRIWVDDEPIVTFSPWLSKDYSTCVELTPEGESEVLIRDLREA